MPKNGLNQSTTKMPAKKKDDPYVRWWVKVHILAVL
jgi:hypothetical protein